MNRIKLRVQGFTATFRSPIQLNFDESITDPINDGLMWSTGHSNAFKTPNINTKFDWDVIVSTSLDGAASAEHSFQISVYSIPVNPSYTSGPPGLTASWTLCGKYESPLPYSTSVQPVIFNPSERMTFDGACWVIFLFEFLAPPSSNPGGCGGDGCVEFGDGVINFIQNSPPPPPPVLTSTHDKLLGVDFIPYVQKSVESLFPATLRTGGDPPKLVPGNQHTFIWKVPDPNGNPAVGPNNPAVLSTREKKHYQWQIDLRAEIRTDKPQTPVPPEDKYTFVFETFRAGGPQPPEDPASWEPIRPAKRYTHDARNDVSQLIQYDDFAEIDPTVIDPATQTVWIKHKVTLVASKALDTNSVKLVWGPNR